MIFHTYNPMFQPRHISLGLFNTYELAKKIKFKFVRLLTHYKEKLTMHIQCLHTIAQESHLGGDFSFAAGPPSVASRFERAAIAVIAAAF